jgi:hypothetical protein
MNDDTKGLAIECQLECSSTANTTKDNSIGNESLMLDWLNYYLV